MFALIALEHFRELAVACDSRAETLNLIGHTQEMRPVVKCDGPSRFLNS